MQLKIAADQLAISYFRSFELPVKIVRPFNTYGPRQSARAIIPSVISQIMNKQQYIRLGNTTPTRDLTYVKDTCNGFLKIFKCKNLFGEVVNVGMKQEITINDLVKKIIKASGSNIQIKPDRAKLDQTKVKWTDYFYDNAKLIENTLGACL